jgi:hypothetical protein
MNKNINNKRKKVNLREAKKLNHENEKIRSSK